MLPSSWHKPDRKHRPNHYEQTPAPDIRVVLRQDDPGRMVVVENTLHENDNPIKEQQNSNEKPNREHLVMLSMNVKC